MVASADTIVAPATGGGRTAVAVIRLSGERAGEALAALAGPLPPPRRLTLRCLVDPRDGSHLDQALVAWMPGPASYTGEDTAEIHCHGGPAVRAGLLSALGSLGLRLAEPGEFTRRALLNGRLDLTEVEGLADLIDAETEAQRRQALRQLEGGLGQRVSAWREALLQASARLEAALDFADEGAVDADELVADAGRRMSTVRGEIEAVLAEGRRGERLREGLKVVIAGPPNAGKSTLMNVLARRDVAIVSEIPGTTRDAIEVRLDLGGMPVHLVDTAGLRESDDPVEREGVARSLRHLADADLVLWLVPPTGETSPPNDILRIVVGTKSDLGLPSLACDLAVSALSGSGMDSLLARLQAEASTSLGQGDALVTRLRHRDGLECCVAALLRGAGTDEPELAAEDLRSAIQALGSIVGHVGVEAMLDRLFAGFCIGK